jgi:hypothetical protein
LSLGPLANPELPPRKSVSRCSVSTWRAVGCASPQVRVTGFFDVCYRRYVRKKARNFLAPDCFGRPGIFSLARRKWNCWPARAATLQEERRLRDPAKRSRIRGMPNVNGTSRRFFISDERCSSRSWATSASAFLAATMALIYFRKSTPHFSHLPPWRCSCLQEGHS